MDQRAIVLGGRSFCLRDFLATCAHSRDPELMVARDALLAGGLPAVRSLGSGSSWVQVGLAVTRGSLSPLYGVLLRTAEELLGDGACNFFFMHKPPGLRVRFEVPGALRERTHALLGTRAAEWREAGLLDSATPACYEPEAHLFGGPVSMVSVHRLFTADALAWLGFHVLDRAGPDWAFSLALLRRLFDALRVVGWEDRDVWDRVRRSTGRRLSPSHLAVDTYGKTAEALRRTWASPEQVDALLSAEARALVEQFAVASAAESFRWHEAYFDTAQAYVGPREVAAFFAVYHWNRGGLPIERQSLLAEALS